MDDLLDIYLLSGITANECKPIYFLYNFLDNKNFFASYFYHFRYLTALPKEFEILFPCL